MKGRLGFLAWSGMLLASLAVIYLPGLDNELVFDDRHLIEGRRLWLDYGGLLQFKQRLLSYGSFVWVENLAGEGWWKQRVVNVLLHLAVVAALYALYDKLSTRVVWPEAIATRESFAASRQAAVRVSILLFSSNPVAIYAVAYLIQRSIVAATLFSVLSCLALVYGLLQGRSVWFVVALLLYLFALLCKEHALLLPGVWLLLYVFLRRPSLRSLALPGACSIFLVGAGGAALFALYGEIIGVPFDPLSQVYLQQLQMLAPDIEGRIWALSAMNQAELFFRYGAFWVFPNPDWMSVDLRPGFPLGFGSLPELAGVTGYLALIAFAVRALLRGSGPLGFAALCVLIPAVLFMTEFLVVWVQDPFVLYRSYLWAIGLPGLIILLLIEFRPYVIYLVGAVLTSIFCLIAFERVDSFKSSLSVWSDAAEKVDLQAAPNAVGRWRPFLNRGAQYLEQQMPAPADIDFDSALALGEVRGHAFYMKGIAAQLMQRYEAAVGYFNAAEEKGVSDIGALYFNRAEARLAQGKIEGVFDDLVRANELPMAEQTKEQVAIRLASVALGTGHYDVAQATYQRLVDQRPEDFDLRLGLGLSYAAMGLNDEAIRILEALLLERDHPAVRHGLALAYKQLGRRDEAREHIERAIRLDPRNPNFREFLKTLTTD